MILGIIQARLTSTRLPAKVLLPVLERPMIVFMVKRLELSKELEKVVVAIPDNEENRELEEVLQAYNILYFKGDENDVLNRFYEAAKKFGDADIIIRLTGDCPLVDPASIDNMVRKFREDRYDYIRTGHSFADGQGTEVFSMHALERARNEANDIEDREHVTTYFKKFPDSFKCLSVENEADQTNYRYTVDCKEDYQVVTEIANSLIAKNKQASAADIADFLDKNPEIRNLNQQYTRQHLDFNL